jgi:hypothetical protein
MSPKTLKAQLLVTPFRPFALEMANGKSVVVQHGDFVLCPPGTSDIVVYDIEGGYQFIDLDLVTSLKVLRKSKSRAA